MRMKDYKSMEDYALICECLKKDDEAFAELMARYKSLAYSIVIRMVNNKDDADDLAQEIFVKVYINLDKYHPDFKFSTWLMRIATNHVIDFRRKKKYDTTSIEGMLTEPEHNETPEAVAIVNERNKQLKDALDSLPDMYKMPIVLYHQQGMSYQDISDVLGEPLSKVKNRIFRGRKLLKDYLTDSKVGVAYEL